MVDERGRQRGPGTGPTLPWEARPWARARPANSLGDVPKRHKEKQVDPKAGGREF